MPLLRSARRAHTFHIVAALFMFVLHLDGTATAGPGLPVVAVQGGNGFTCSLDTGGVVSCWGTNEAGELGDGSKRSSLTQRAVWGRSDALALAVGGSHACALSLVAGARYVLCWGADEAGQMGDSPLVHAPTMVSIEGPVGSRPLLVSIAASDPDIAALGSGAPHTCAVSANGEVWCWAGNGRGQLGNCRTTDGAYPARTSGAIDAIAVAGRGAHTCARDRSSTVWCWGANDHGQLGDGTTTDGLTPTPVPGLNDVGAITGGGEHSCALRSSGVLLCWGPNDTRLLVDRTTVEQTSPVPIASLTGVTAIAAGGAHTCALAAGVGWCWGSNAPGQLGNGPRTNATSPSPVPGVPALVAIGVGSDQSCGLGAELAAHCWGGNSHGQLGDNTTLDRPQPVQTRGLPTHAFGAIAPARLLDTRAGGARIDGLGSGAGPRHDGPLTTVPVAGRAGVPVDATAVVLNVRVTEPAADRYISVYDCDAARPWESNLNFASRETIADAVTVGLSHDGSVCLYNLVGSTHLIEDITGLRPADDDYSTVQPARLFDSRPTATTVDGTDAAAGIRPAGSLTALHVAGRAAVASDAESVVLNVTAIDSTSAGFVTVWPCGARFPPTSSLSIGAGRVSTKAVTVRLGLGGQVCIWVDSADTNLIVDVNGYHPAGVGFDAIYPVRLADTRQTQTLKDRTTSWAVTGLLSRPTSPP